VGFATNNTFAGSFMTKNGRSCPLREMSLLFAVLPSGGDEPEKKSDIKGGRNKRELKKV